MALRIDQNMAFTTFDFLACIIATHPTDFSGLHALAIQTACTWVRTAPCRSSGQQHQGPIHPFPSPISTPFAVVIIHTPWGRKLLWQVGPLTACLEQIENGIHHMAHLQLDRTAWTA